MEPLPRSYLEALGKIVDAMSGAESALIYSISRIVGNDMDTTLCLIGGESIDILNSKANKLIHSRLKNEDLLKAFDMLRRRLDTLNEERNKYIHALWLTDGPNVMRVKYTKRSKTGALHQVDRHVEVQILLDLSRNIQESEDSLLKLVADNIELLTNKAT